MNHTGFDFEKGEGYMTHVHIQYTYIVGKYKIYFYEL
jgi:hypothetical protein